MFRALGPFFGGTTLRLLNFSLRLLITLLSAANKPSGVCVLQVYFRSVLKGKRQAWCILKSLTTKAKINNVERLMLSCIILSDLFLTAFVHD